MRAEVGGWFGSREEEAENGSRCWLSGFKALHKIKSVSLLGNLMAFDDEYSSLASLSLQRLLVS